MPPVLVDRLPRVPWESPLDGVERAEKEGGRGIPRPSMGVGGGGGAGAGLLLGAELPVAGHPLHVTLSGR